MFSVELYARVRRTCIVEGLSRREAARRFGIGRKTVAKMLAHAVPPGYRRIGPPLLFGRLWRETGVKAVLEPTPRKTPESAGR